MCELLCSLGYGCSAQVTVGGAVVSVCGNQTSPEICEHRHYMYTLCLVLLDQYIAQLVEHSF